MGIHKRNNSKYWYIQFVLNGGTYVKSSKTTNRRLAERMERQWRDELLEQTALGGKKSITVGDALKKFAHARRKYASHRVILSNIKHILGAIDETKFLHDVRKKDVVRLVERLEGEEKSASTIRNVMNNFRAALNYNDGLGYRTPLLEWPQIKPARKRLRYLTLEEEQHLIGELDSARKCRGMSPEDSRRACTQDNQDLVVILLDTGARLNEIQQLEWKQVDLEKRQIHLWRPKVKNESVLFMTDRVYGILRRRYDERRSDGWVFVDESGSKPRHNHKRSMRNAFDRAELQDCSLHTLRHTFASRLVQAGVSLYKVSQLLGHTEIRTTQIYAHLSPENAASEAVSVLNQLNGVASK